MKVLAIISLSLLVVTPQVFAKVNVFACEPEWKALTEAIGGDRVEVYTATTAFQDPHYVEARPSLIAKTRRADLLVCTGAELEVGWLPLLLRQSGNTAVQESESGYFLAASQVERIEVPIKLDRSHGDVHASGNPHVHWGPYRLLTIAGALSQRLQEIDPANAEYYQQQSDHFTKSWNAAIGRWEQQTADLKGKKAIVYHKNWSYLLNWLQVEMIGDLEPKPGIPPTSSHLASLLSTVRLNKPDFILVTNYQNDKGAQWLSKKSGVPVLSLPYTVGGSKDATDLISLYDDVLSRLAEVN